MAQDQDTNGPARTPRLDRRGLFRTAGLGAGALALGSMAASGVARAGDGDGDWDDRGPLDDSDILNFALNLEYLEAEFYLRAVNGTGLAPSEVTGEGNQGKVTGGSKVPFTTAVVRQYATEIANDEHNHVLFLRKALGPYKVAEPTIDLVSSFTDAAIAAGLISKGQTFDPFSSEDNFLLGAFIFEDVGVTAYHGASPLIRNKAYLLAAAGILGTEAYHASEIRLLILQNGLANAANKISAARAALDGSPNGGHDQGVTVNGVPNIVPTDANGLTFARTFKEVKNIVYLGGEANEFGFFPKLLNGRIR